MTRIEVGALALERKDTKYAGKSVSVLPLLKCDHLECWVFPIITRPAWNTGNYV